MVPRLSLLLITAVMGFAMATMQDDIANWWEHMKPVEKPPVHSESTPAKQAITATLSRTLSNAFGMQPGAERSRALKTADDALAKLSPNAALESLLSQTPSAARDQALLKVYERLIASSLSGAVAWAEKHPLLVRLGRAKLESALAALASHDGPSAWSLLLRLRSVDRLVNSTGLLRNWIKGNPEQALATGFAIGSPTDRHEFVSTALRSWMDQSTSAFLTWSRRQTPGSLLPYLSSSGTPNESTTLPQLIELANLLPHETTNNPYWSSQIARIFDNSQVRKQSPAMIRSILDPDLRDQFWGGLIEATAHADPVSAQSFLYEIQDATKRATAASIIAGCASDRDPQAALTFAASLPDDLSRSGALHSVLGTWFNKDSAGALAYVTAHKASLGTDLVCSVLSSWRPDNMQAAANWAISQSDDDLITAMNFRLTSWIKDQPSEFRGWAQSTPPSPAREKLLRALVDSLQSSWDLRPAEASSVIDLMVSAEDRQESAQKLMPAWTRTDPTAAKRWHDSAVSSGRIRVITEQDVSPQPKSPAGSSNNSDHIAARRPDGSTLNYQSGITGRTYQYTGNGMNFTVFY